MTTVPEIPDPSTRHQYPDLPSPEYDDEYYEPPPPGFRWVSPQERDYWDAVQSGVDEAQDWLEGGNGDAAAS